MKRRYRNELRIIALGDKKFDRLPYKHAKTSLGLAIPKEKTAYIRMTPDYYENKDTLHHEMSELLTSTSAHEEDGVRYKKWYQYIPGGQQVREFLDPIIPESQSSIGAGLGTGLGMLLAPFTGGTSLAFLNPATLGTTGGAIGGYQDQGDLANVLLGGLKGFGVGSLGTGLQAMAGPETGLKGNIGEFLKGAVAPTETLLGWLGLGGTGGATTAGGATGGLNTYGVPSVSGTLSNAPMTAMSDILGGGAIPGGNLMASEGASSTGLLSKLLGGGGGGSTLAKLLPTLLMGGMYMGQSAPERPAYMPSQEMGLASQSYQNLLGQVTPEAIQQNLFAPVQSYMDLQKSDAMRNLRTQAAQQGYLDSTAFTNQQTDIDKYYGTQGGLALADLMKWGTGQATDISSLLAQLGLQTTNIPYQAEMDVYNQEEASRQALLQSIFGQIGNIFNPDPMSEYLKRILG